MAKRNIHVPEEWIVVADAGPSYKNPARWGHFVAAYRIHRDSTVNRPLAEGAAYVGNEIGINRAEYMAAIMGLRHVADRMWFGEWARDPVNIVTDNALRLQPGDRSFERRRSRIASRPIQRCQSFHR
jgi:ribonuclease HI